jgi:hypothetical protein
MKLSDILKMPMSPLSPLHIPGQYRCFICWESSQEKSDFITPCKCKSESLKHAHKKCLDSWVNDNKKDACSVCLVQYKIEMAPLPLIQVLKGNMFVFISFGLQVLIPILIYTWLFFSGALQDVNPWFIFAHISMLLLLYSLFAFHLFAGIERYQRRVVSPSTPSASFKEKYTV